MYTSSWCRLTGRTPFCVQIQLSGQLLCTSPAGADLKAGHLLCTNLAGADLKAGHLLCTNSAGADLQAGHLVGRCLLISVKWKCQQ